LVLAKFSPLTLALLRLFAAFMFFQLGAQRLFGGFGADAPVASFSPPWFLGVAELIGSLALAAGWFTRPFAVILAVDMVAVYLGFHAAQGTFLPISRNRVTEEVFQLMTIAALFAVWGPERFSVEGVLGKTREDRFAKYRPTALGVFRILTGLIFMTHGLQKLFAVGGRGEEFGTLRWFGGCLEFFGGWAIALGLLTAPVAFILCGEMAVAYFMSHNTRGFWPLQNNGIRAVLFCYTFLFFLTTGPGKFSLDEKIWKKNRAETREPVRV
jgi:putative oxidoreductase